MSARAIGRIAVPGLSGPGRPGRFREPAGGAALSAGWLSDRGSAAIEAALVIPVVLLVMLAGFELTALAATRLEMVAAAREGARVAATIADPVRAVAAVRSALDEPLASRAAVSVRRPSVPGRQAEVSVRVLQKLRTPLLDAFSVPIVVRAAMAVEP